MQNQEIRIRTSEMPSHMPFGMRRVLEPIGVLPQAALRLDPSPELHDDEVRVRLEALHVDAASFRQLFESNGGDGSCVRRAVLDIVRAKGKLQNPVTGSGGTFVGRVEEKGPRAPMSMNPGERLVSLTSLTATPLAILDDLARWNGVNPQVPLDGHAIIAASSPVAPLPDDLDSNVALAAFDVCGAPALTVRLIRERAQEGQSSSVCVIGASGKSGALSSVAARRFGAPRVVGIVPNAREARVAQSLDVFDAVVVADARFPLELYGTLGEQFGITISCVDAPGCEHGAILATAPGGAVIFFSMATNFSVAALGAESIGADVRMLVGNGFVPGHAEMALDLLRQDENLRSHFLHSTRI